MSPRLAKLVKFGIIALLVVLPFLGCLARAQEPDRRGEAVTKKAVYRGTHANCPIPPEMHQRNSRGWDGAGLCVIASLVTNLRYQGVPEVVLQKIWSTAQSRRGGYSPDKLEKLLREIMPDAKWISYYGTDIRVLSELSAKGLPIGATMSWGQGYPGRIHHMISLLHFDEKLACVVDNNDPGVYHWMPSAEYGKRWFDGGYGWAVAFLPPELAIHLMIISAAILLFAVLLMLLAIASWFATSPKRG